MTQFDNQPFWDTGISQSGRHLSTGLQSGSATQNTREKKWGTPEWCELLEPLFFLHPGWSPLGVVPASAKAAQLGGVA